jgi:predicted PolB exonuclease-like 3'-5' exonuclease
LVTFNGNSFDLPLLRYRAMVNRVPAIGLQVRACKIIGLAGKPTGVDGSQVEAMVNAGQIDEVARYCESDILNTYRVWLVYEHFRGTITTAQLEWSEVQIREFVRAGKLANPHLNAAMGIASPN